MGEWMDKLHNWVKEIVSWPVTVGLMVANIPGLIVDAATAGIKKGVDRLER